ncbi:MAG: fused MFS/spermidine synthase [Vicinamibacteria bacterium]
MSRVARSSVVFTTGAAILALEILASRYMLPVFGTSIFVWGAILSITLISLAVGYQWGGALGDQLPKPHLRLVRHILISAGWIAALPLWGTLFLRLGLSTGALLGPIVVTAVLFAFPLTLLATTVPLAFGSALQEGEPGPGKTLGSLFAISTAGSVLGALVTAYIAVPFIGSNRAFLLIAALLFVIVAPFVFRGTGIKAAILVASGLVASKLIPPTARGVPEHKAGVHHLYRADTRYAQVDVLEDERDGSRVLLLDGASQNWVAGRNWSESQFDYIPALQYHVARFRPPPGRALVLGLGAGTLVRDLGRRGYDVEAVEIDPLVHEVARTYFSFPSEAATLHFSDARAFLERAVEAGKTFDVIIMDVTGGGHHPEHIYKRDAYLLIERLLAHDGVMGANMVVFTHAPLDRAARYSAATLASVFPVVEAVDLQPDAGETDNLSQLLLFGAFLKPRAPFDEDRGQRLLPIEKDLRPLTDDWNPLPLWSIRANARWHRNMREWLGEASYLP